MQAGGRADLGNLCALPPPCHASPSGERQRQRDPGGTRDDVRVVWKCKWEKFGLPESILPDLLANLVSCKTNRLGHVCTSITTTVGFIFAFRVIQVAVSKGASAPRLGRSSGSPAALYASMSGPHRLSPGIWKFDLAGPAAGPDSPAACSSVASV